MFKPQMLTQPAQLLLAHSSIFTQYQQLHQIMLHFGLLLRIVNRNKYLRQSRSAPCSRRNLLKVARPPNASRRGINADAAYMLG